jgi:hypothetical protein
MTQTNETGQWWCRRDAPETWFFYPPGYTPNTSSYVVRLEPTARNEGEFLAVIYAHPHHDRSCADAEYKNMTLEEAKAMAVAEWVLSHKVLQR